MHETDSRRPAKTTVRRPRFRRSRLLLVAPLLIGTSITRAGALGAQGTARSPLDALVEIGLQRNLGRKQELLAVARADASVREARGLYLPSATFNARYTELSGNTINLGSLINPAFGALNQLLDRPAFPTNVDIQLPQRQETTVRVAQPIFRPDIIAANRIRVALADAQGASRDAQARQLAADIKSAYLSYAKVRQVVALYDSTLPLLDEQLRVSERLVQAGKATPDMILRARAERSDVLQRRDEGVQLAEAAREGLNLLLDRPLETDVPVYPDSLLGFGALPPLDSLRRSAAASREEVRQLDHLHRAARAQERLAQGSFLPSVSVALDYGVQGKEYRFDSSRDFTALTVAVSWNLFNGGQDTARVQQASLDADRLAVQQRALEQGIALDVTMSWQAAAVARSAIATANDRLTSARRTFELVKRKQEEGIASQLEFLDARTTYTSAALNEVITRYDYLLKRVALERAAGSADIDALVGSGRER